MTDKHAPDSLKYQWRILGHVLRSGWATSLDKSIAFEIVDNYVKRHGNSRASLSYLVKATGADRKSVIASTRRLVEHGPFSVARQGVGTRPTEYVIHFEKVQDLASSGADTTTSSEHTSSGMGTTTGGGVDTTTSASSSGADTTESVLHVTGLQAGLQDRMIEPAPPTAPLSDGLSATDAEGAGGGFEELWRAYFPGKGLGSKAAARETYKTIGPDTEKHAEIVAAARDWLAAWSAQGDTSKPRKHLHVWLREENFECDPPTAFKPKERKVKVAPAASNDNEPADDVPDWMRGSPRLWPVGRHEGELVDGEVEALGGGDVEVRMTFQRNDGETFQHRFFIESVVRSYEEAGNETLREIMRALDVASTDDTDELLFKPLAVVADGSTLTYIKAP